MTALLLLAVMLMTASAERKMGYFGAEVKQRIQNPPMPVPGLNIDAGLGNWFVQYRKAPSSWSGSSDFTDYEAMFVRQGNRILDKETWREDFCTKTTAGFYPRAPGIFTVKDSIGDTWSGKLVVVSIDYKNFFIVWGCTKKSVFGDKCDDPWLSVATRQRYPGPKVFTMVDSELRRIFGVSLNELQKVVHGKPCGHAEILKG